MSVGWQRYAHTLYARQETGEPLQLTNNELEQLRTRVIALENLVIALLADKSDRQLDLAREMAAYISPRPGSTQHPLTIHAAAQMIHLVERSGHFRTNASAIGCSDGTATPASASSK